MSAADELERELDRIDDGQVLVVVKTSTAAAMLDCSRPQIYNLIAEGHLRRVHIGRMSRIPVEDIYRLVGLEAPQPTAAARFRARKAAQND